MLTFLVTMTSPAGGAGAHAGVEDLHEAYRMCETIAREHYENFPVASRFLSGSARRALSAVYAFARQADDFADEGYGPEGPSSNARLEALDHWEGRLRASLGCERENAVPSSTPTRRPRTSRRPEASPAPPLREGTPWTVSSRRGDAIFLALGDTIRRHRIPEGVFFDLLSAFRQDVEVSSYPTREDLLDYCMRSANPVGRIVLAVHGVHDDASARASDSICTGLQLANFWQDVGIDAMKARIYLPQSDLEAFDVRPEDLRRRAASAGLKNLILEETRWTRSFFEDGRALFARTPWPLRFHLRLVWHGGVRILEMIERVGGDVLARRPRLRKPDLFWLVLRSMAHGWTG